MTAALWFGGSVIAVGSLMAGAVAAAHRERITARLAPQHGRERARSTPSFEVATAVFVAGLAFAVLVGWTLAGPAGAAAGAAAWILAHRSRQRQTARKVEDAAERQLRDAVVALASGLRAGHSIRRAIREATRDAEEPLRGALEDATAALDVGEPLADALGRLRNRVPSDDVRLLVGVLTLHARTGGDLPTLLDEVADLLAQRLDERRQVRALTAQARASGAVLAALPVAFVALLSGAGGDGLGDFYRTPLGAGLLGLASLLDAAGFAWMRRITHVAEAGR